MCMYVHVLKLWKIKICKQYFCYELYMYMYVLNVLAVCAYFVIYCNYIHTNISISVYNLFVYIYMSCLKYYISCICICFYITTSM